MPAVTYEMKRFFLDRSAVLKRIDRARAGTLRRQAAFVRTRWRTSVLRRRKSTSRPGSPPNIKSRNRVRSLKNILYFYDPASESVVVGMVRLNRNRLANPRPLGSQTVSNLITAGGRERIQQERSQSGNAWRIRRLSRPRIPGRQTRSTVAVYKPRPSGSIALDDEIKAGTNAQSWRNVVRD